MSTDSTNSVLGVYMRALHQQNFFNAYWKAFDVVTADTDELRAKAFRLRYLVYCKDDPDCEYSDNDAPIDPALLEQDTYDERAVHHLLIHKPSGKTAGTVRVLLPSEDNALSSFSLQTVCDHPLLGIEQRVTQLCEISRLCMSPEFRRRPGDGRVLPAYSEQENGATNGTGGMHYFRRRIPYAPLGLIQAAFETAMSHRFLDCISVMDPHDFRSLKRIGLTYRVLGPRIDYLGRQQPIIFNIKNVLDMMAANNPECYEVVSDHGRLSERASTLAQERWQDNIFDEVTQEMILHKLL